MFESAEEKAEKKRAREEEEARADAARQALLKASEEERSRKARLASPVGAATAAKEAGEEFFEIQLEVGGHVGVASWGAASGTRAAASSAGTLGEIERAGWRLEHASHVFMITGETSSQRVFLTGEATAVSGAMIGIYLFRNDRTRSAAEPTQQTVA